MSEQKPDVLQPTKSSMEILSELFGTFDAEPPVIVKKEKDEEESKRHKKKKKKHHKHKTQKSKSKKSKKRKHDDPSEDEKDDLVNLLIKQERKSPEKKIKLEEIKIEAEDIKVDVEDIKLALEDIKVKVESSTESETKVNESNGKLKDDSDLQEDKDEKKEDEKDISKKPKNKIVIKDLKNSKILENISNPDNKDDAVEEGELSSDFSMSSLEETTKHKHRKEKHKRKHKHSLDEKSKKRKHSRHHTSSREKSDKSIKSSFKEREKSPVRKDHKSYRDSHSPSKDKKDFSCHDRWCKYKYDISKDHSRCRNSKDDYDDDFYRERRAKSKSSDDFYKDKDKSRNHDDYKHKYRDEKRLRDDFYKDSDRSRGARLHTSTRDRYRSYSETSRNRGSRDRSRHKDEDDYIDKKKLLEIARRNAIQMMKSGQLPGALTLGPQAQEKVLAAIKAGGKTIAELTDFCKTLSKKEELGELSSVSEDDGDDSVHHPFQLKDRSNLDITSSISKSVKPVPERSTALTLQFPVSSGTLHRRTEAEVEAEAEQIKNSLALVPLTSSSTPTLNSTVVAPIVSTGTTNIEQPQQVTETDISKKASTTEDNTDIGSIVSERLMAIRQLQENPNNTDALSKIEKSQQEMQTWAESKQRRGQFTGSTGAQILSQAQLASGYQAWARKDQLQNAAPIMGGMGMHLLKKMGWNPGEGLGKEKTGTLEPLQLEVKLDKKGLLANEEGKPKPPKGKATKVALTFEEKHPVSLLGEYASKKKLGPPLYELCHESGPDHKKMFLFKVLLNGIEFRPNVACLNKKQAKAEAARLCLQKLCILPPTPANPT